MQSISVPSLAAAVAAAGSVYLAGTIGSISMVAMPGIKSTKVPAQLLAQQWKAMFDIGKAVAPKIALVSLAGYGYAAYHGISQGGPWRALLAGGILTVAIVPFTLMAMSPTNNALMAVADGAAKGVNDEAVTALASRWSSLNLARSSLPLFGGIVGFWALLG